MRSRKTSLWICVDVVDAVDGEGGCYASNMVGERITGTVVYREDVDKAQLKSEADAFVNADLKECRESATE